MQRILFTFFCSVLFSATEILAASAIPVFHDVLQPDGGTFMGKWVGDERLNYLLTEDGYVVVKDLLGFYSDADENGEGSGVYVHDVEYRTSAEVALLAKINPQKTIRALEEKVPKAEEFLFDYSPVVYGVRKKFAPGDGVLLASPMTNSSLAVGNKKCRLFGPVPGFAVFHEEFCF